jgi:hypothetical protein
VPGVQRAVSVPTSFGGVQRGYGKSCWGCRRSTSSLMRVNSLSATSRSPASKCTRRLRASGRLPWRREARGYAVNLHSTNSPDRIDQNTDALRGSRGLKTSQSSSAAATKARCGSILHGAGFSRL